MAVIKAGSSQFPFHITDIAALLRLNIRRRGPDFLYVDCPLCGDHRGKLYLKTSRDVWHCNYCQESGGMLALYAKVYGISNADAYREICEALQTGDYAPEYWAIYTPNVTRTSIYENPSIVASNDGAHWEAPVGLTNPIDPQPSSTRYHNCDADMIYNPEMDAMMGYWNWADDQAGGVGAEVRLRISYDGVHWGIPVTYDAQTRTWTKPTTEEERQVVSGPTDFIPAVTSSARYDMLSPTFVYDSFRDIFMMWSNNTGDVGYNNGQSNFVELRYSDDGITWGQPTRVNNFLGTNESGQQLAPWHQDVQYVPELKEFLCISQCFSGGNPDGSVLHFTKSKDGLNWEPVGNKPLLSPGEDGSWDDFQIYRSSFYYDPGEEVGNGMIRVWYSALQKNTNNILVADSSGNKTLQAKDQDDRIWRIGYASNSYIAMMKSLMNDSEYTVPALIPGTSMTLTRDNANAKVYAGDTTTVQASFLPEDTSDQLVKFSSSDPSVATVNQHGVVTTISAGTVNIIGETREGLTATLELTVEPNVFSLIPQSTMTASATSEHASTSEGPASYVLDGNSSTIWHTAYNPKVDLPQTLTVSFGQTRTVGRYVYTPRQVGTNGIVTQYELYAVQGGGEAVLIASGSWAEDHTDKIVTFDPVDAILMQLAGIHRMLGFVERLLGLFTLFRVYGAGRNRLLILVKLAGVLPLLLGSGLRTGMGVAVCVRPADGRLRLLRLNDIFLRRCRAHSIARDFAACHADESAAEKACRCRASDPRFSGRRNRTVTAVASQCAADRAGRGVDGAHGDHCF